MPSTIYSGAGRCEAALSRLTVTSKNFKKLIKTQREIHSLHSWGEKLRFPTVN